MKLHILILLSLLVILVESTGIRIPLTRHKKEESRLLKFRMEKKKVGVEKNSEKIDLHNFENVQYYGTVSVGTPKQTFKIMFDTGSDVFWIPGPHANGTCGGYTKFNSSLSKTYINLNQTLPVAYVTGYNNLDLATETISLGDLVVRNQTIGLVTSGDCEGHGFDGLMGMSPRKREIAPVFETMISQKVVDSPLFAFYLHRNASMVNESNGGELYLGGYDKTYVKESEINFLPLVKDGSSWEVELKSVTINNTVLSLNATTRFDTGASTIVGPEESINRMVKVVGGFIEGDHIVINCTDLDRMPPLIFNIGGKEYSYTGRDLLMERSEGLCLLAIQFNSLVTDHWILGDVFLSKVYVIHDYAKNKIAIPHLSFRGSATTPSAMGAVILSMLCTLLQIIKYT